GRAALLQLDANNYVTANTNSDRSSLRNAAQQDTFVMNNDSTQQFQPHFTFHGFRYAEVSVPLSVAPGLNLSSLTGCVIHSSAPISGAFTCSDTNVSKLMTNILWTLRAHVYGAFIDCPQRDERYGGMG